MERWSSNTITFTTMQLSVIIQPVLRTITALFDASASSTFARRMEFSTMQAEGSVRLSVDILSVYVDEV